MRPEAISVPRSRRALLTSASAERLDTKYAMAPTPKKQETWKFLGTLVSAATVGGVILVLNKVYGFSGPDALVAPQANAMAKVIDG